MTATQFTILSLAVFSMLSTGAEIIHTIRMIKAMRKLLDEQEDQNYCLQREKSDLEHRQKQLLAELEKSNKELAEYKRKWKKAAEFNTILREDINRISKQK